MRRSNLLSKSALFVVGLVFVTAVAVRAVGTSVPTSAGIEDEIVQGATQEPAQPAAAGQDIVLRGRYLVISHACGECHGGGNDPAAKGFLAGLGASEPPVDFKIGPPPCGIDPAAKGCFTTRPRNLTPDEATGMGRFTERQLFNALRFGLRPEDTPDVVITGTTPGKGNFPMRPHYVAPPMPWTAWRHMPDADLRAIAAYLKRGLKPVVNKVADSEGPPDFWASAMVPENIGVYPAKPFPQASEQQPPAAQRARVLRGRQLVLEHGCGDCHGGAQSPEKPSYLAGITSDNQAFVIGPCFQDPKAPCFKGRPKNITPDKETGIGRWTDQQVFNALRYGLKPEETPNVKITSSKPGVGNFPKEPKYLGPFMPWASWRHMPDEDLLSIIAYLRHGVKPVSNKVALSDDTPDHWASAVAVAGPRPASPFPTANEVKRK
ncbi:MAG TPA: cytochrome c [Vicinamibacterales bacterium]|nr:cytochrome c [Vicinamibacterales bacterium]